MVCLFIRCNIDNMVYVGCQDGSIRCVDPSRKDVELENYSICRPHVDGVRKVCMRELFNLDYYRKEYGRIHSNVFSGYG